MKMMLYSPRPSPRLAYIADYVFTRLLGLTLRITQDRQEYLSHAGPRCNYSTTGLATQEVRLHPHALLFEQEVREQPLATTFVDGIPAIFAVPPGYALPFDPLAAAFFVLTRYEEYLPFAPDRHGRYPAHSSWAARSQCLSYPIVWTWTKLISNVIQASFPAWRPQPPGYRFHPTYDIDLPWAFRHRGLRGLARTGFDLLSGNWPQLKARWQVWTRRAEDPYYTFERLRRLHATHEIRPRIFWLLADRSREDINPSWRSSAYRRLITEVSQWSDSGIHPGYYTYRAPEHVQREKDRLAEILGQTVTHGRQHFLRLSLPATYRALLAAGIRDDYTMGFAAQAGYRAGTTEPFRWYDLEREHVTELTVHPFAVMDVTLKQYQAQDTAAARATLQAMQTYCRREGLTFRTLWHNSSFSAAHGWAGWWEVYEELFKG